MAAAVAAQTMKELAVAAVHLGVFGIGQDCPLLTCVGSTSRNYIAKSIVDRRATP